MSRKSKGLHHAANMPELLCFTSLKSLIILAITYIVSEESLLFIAGTGVIKTFKLWGTFTASVMLFLIKARMSSRLIFGSSTFENTYHTYVDYAVYYVVGCLLIVSVKLVRNSASVMGILLACGLALLQTAMKTKYLINLYENPFKYNSYGKYHVLGRINYANKTIFPITLEEVRVEQGLVTFLTFLGLTKTMFLLLASGLHIRFIMGRCCGINTVDPSNFEERKASYESLSVQERYRLNPQQES